MEHAKQISKAEFLAKYKRTGNHEDAIFSSRLALMEKIYATGNPIYVDQSYYAQCDKLDLVEKVGEHFHCDGYEKFESWRDCHYYTEYADAAGNRAWLMTGGRYD